MRYFPIFVDLASARVVVVGGSEEALRKVRLLLKTQARIEVIARELHPELAAEPRVHWIAKEYSASLLDGATLVYSADAGLNETVSVDAKARGIHVNAVDDAEISTFIVPSIVDRDPVVVAIGTEGTAPVLGQWIRARVDGLLAQNLGALASKAQSLRGAVAEAVPHGWARRAFWRQFFFGEPRQAFDAGDDVAFTLSFQDAVMKSAETPAGQVALFTAPAQADDVTLRMHRLLQEADVIVHDPHVPHAVLELARRDAVRIPGSGWQADAEVQQAVAKGKQVVRLAAAAAEAAHPAASPTASIVPFPVRDDIRDQILKAVS